MEKEREGKEFWEGEGKGQLVTFCLREHIRRQPEGLHTAIPCFLHPTASARQSGDHCMKATAPVRCGLCPQSTMERIRLGDAYCLSDFLDCTRIKRKGLGAAG